MSSPSKAEVELRGWKDIAAFLGVTEGTAKNYEKRRGLPVHRLGAGDKQPVWALPSELEAWKLGKPSNGGLARRMLMPSAAPARQQWMAWSGRCLAAAILLAVLALAYFSLRHEEPAAHTLTDFHLVVSDKPGKELWRYAFPHRLMLAFYRPDVPAAWFSDLDGDGSVETLFSYHSVERASLGTWLYCFDKNGKVKWTFKAGKALSTKHREFTDVYLISDYVVLPRQKGRESLVAVTSNHANGYPDQVAVLNSRGGLAGEYWHSGHLLYARAADIDDDGRDELLLGGVNDGQGRATLVVFDPLRVAGASTQPAGDHTQFQGLSRGSEKRVLLFPRSSITEAGYEKFNRVHQIDVTPSGIEVFVSQTIQRSGPYLIYHFDRQLGLKAVTVSSLFENRHRELEAAGKLKGPIDQHEMQQLRQIEIIHSR